MNCYCGKPGTFRVGSVRPEILPEEWRKPVAKLQESDTWLCDEHGQDMLDRGASNVHRVGGSA